MDNVSRKVEIIRKSEKYYDFKKGYNRNEECLQWVIGRQDTAEKRISGLEDFLTETPKAEEQTKKDWKKKKRISKNCGITIKDVTYT